MMKAPIIFEPYYKRAIWGGRAIADYKGEDPRFPDIGESWELSAMPERESVVASGPYAGRSLSELVKEFGSRLLGNRVYARYGAHFPLLVKFIDARENLSVQVHPGDSMARERHDCPGKTEMWYVISALSNSRIYSGLKRTITPEEYVTHVENGTFFDLVASHESKAGDIYYLPSGQVHAIGAGNLLAEIQQPSDITYRIFDYKRKDANGCERTLHTSMALEAIDYRGGRDFRLPRPSDDVALIELLSCEYFSVRRLRVSGSQRVENNEDSFMVLMLIEGEAEISASEASVTLTAGHTALVPADCKWVDITGDATLLIIVP